MSSDDARIIRLSNEIIQAGVNPLGTTTICLQQVTGSGEPKDINVYNDFRFARCVPGADSYALTERFKEMCEGSEDDGTIEVRLIGVDYIVRATWLDDPTDLCFLVLTVTPRGLVAPRLTSD